ncbi:hypothetical protein AVEN_268812-1 [Araneus ventricosus]|uniref:Uncharacterized protein n=1 Tax=Araneus ventricosus TaxID=182803 RepID=A0A4Y2HF39_ARAVE|nr:hypothetical protein AVEN_268812-1 [Araneus ventricosus]
MVSKAYRRLGILKRKTKEFSSEIALKVLYYAHVRSSLEYCSIIWDPIYRNKIEIIERIQNNFLRYLLYKKNGIYLQDVSSSYLRHMFNIPSLCSRRDVSCVLFFYKVINGSIDCTDILSAINFAVPARSLRNQVAELAAPSAFLSIWKVFPESFVPQYTFCQLLGLWNDPARPSVCSSDQLFHAADNVSSLSFPNRSIYLLLTIPTSYEKKWSVYVNFLAEVETDEDSDFSNEDNGPEDILEEIFSDHESFTEHDAKSEEDGDSGSE